MKYHGSLIVVKDIEASKRFYKEVLDLNVEVDFGANVTLTGGFSLQTLDTWAHFIQKDESDVTFGCNNAELYFEADDLDAFCKFLETKPDIKYVHPLREYPWGQRAIRFYDLDKHIIEAGENMVAVVKRFIAAGMTKEEAAERMGVAVGYVEQLLGE